MANHTHGTVNLGKVKAMLRKAKVQAFSHTCFKNPCNLNKSAAKFLMKMQCRCNYNRGSCEKDSLRWCWV